MEVIQMGKKSVKRIVCLLIAVLLNFSIVGTALAANSPVTGTVPTNGSINLYPWLESYIGVSKNFIVNATSNSTSGALLVYLYNPSGKLVSNSWVMGVNEIAKWSVTLPSSGQWRLYIVASGTNASVNIWAKWE
jgi:hypothetical protein